MGNRLGKQPAATPAPQNEFYAPKIVRKESLSVQQTSPTEEAVSESHPVVQSVVVQGPPPIAELLDALLGHNAVRDRQVIQLLEGSNPNQTLNNVGLKPIHVAVLQKNVELLQALLSKRETDVNVRTSGLTPLHLAAQFILVDMLKLLLEKPSILVNALSSEEKLTPLMVAITTDATGITEEERTTVVRCLVDDVRCEVDKADEDGWIALTHAARHGNVQVGKILLADQRSMIYTIDQLVNAYRQAVLGGHDDFCDLLMDSLTTSQKEHIRGLVFKLKEMSGTTPFLRDLLHQVGNILDSGYVGEVQSGPAWDRNDQLLRAGSVIQLLKDKAVVKALQKGIGKHIDSLDNVSGQRGLVTFIDMEGVLTVDFGYFGSAHKKYRHINPKAVDRLSQDDYVGVDAEEVPIQAGDAVRLINDEVILGGLVYESSSGDISRFAGHAAVLKFYDNECHPVVYLAGSSWTVDTRVLSKITMVHDINSQAVHVGDTVEIAISKAVVDRHQTLSYGGCPPEILRNLGKSAIVTHIGCECFLAGQTPDCTITVKTAKDLLVLNPKVVKLLQGTSHPPRTSSSEPDLVNVVHPAKPHDSMGHSAHSALLPHKPNNNNLDVVSSPVEVNDNPRDSPNGLQIPVEPVDVIGSIEPTPADQVSVEVDQEQPSSSVLILRKEPYKNAGVDDVRRLPRPASPNPSRIAPLRTSRRFIPYQELHFGGKIGKGGFGTVYRAKWNGSNCAVKVIKCDDSPDGQETHLDALKEADRHGSVNHPHIVQFLGVSFNDADQLNLNAYIVLKFIDGPNLHQCVFGFKLHLSVGEKIDIAKQVCDAIRYLHDDAKIIHQDIKPHNILIDKNTREAMVTDFGISKVFSDPPLDVTMAMYTQHACGSLPYMAPELVIISRRHSMYRVATKSSDIWSLAATLTEMFTGRFLYDMDVPDLHTLMNFKASPDLPASITKASGAVRAVFESSLQNRPEMRPKSCKELLQLMDIHFRELDMESSDSEV
ncbi:putative Mitogen-activated protein kinase kinase kinase 10 [Hypsibius exemplaris]|uniref:Mitogen-activated protein kinase kinase kinase 10 n=1 Tax=Hypsibius exemplaris TaxID=2072580 RepID=A0A1W0X608_HYPEX|nr:putative Mitogen-activated protein kinase kinase kinase 10 [Hypsibius exemplaris]